MLELPLKLRRSLENLRQREDQLSLVLSLVIGALVGLVVVAFILLTGRLAARMYPAGGAGWRRILVPALGSLSTGYLLWRYFPFARGSGIPQTKFALFINDGRISFRTVFGKVLLLLGFACQRNRAGTRRSVGAGGRRPRFGDRAESGTRSETGEGAGARRVAPRRWRRRSIRRSPRCCSRSKRSWAICTRRCWARWC